MTSKAEARPPDDERCNSMADQGGRCPEAATHVLYNGEQRQGQACDAHTQKLVKDFPFLTAHQVPHWNRRLTYND